MNLKGYSVGLWPYGTNLDKAGDRRRFAFYAKERNLDFEIASINKKYDIVYLTMGCNISEWLKYKKRNPSVKIIFEIIDSYFLQNPGFSTSARGLIKFLNGKESKLFLNYQTAIVEMLKIADAVVCSSDTQKEFLIRYNKNVHISLDFFTNDITHIKTSLSNGKKLKLVWEGQAYTVHNLLLIKDVFKKLADKVELHVITDPTIVYPFKIFNKKTASILSQIKCDQYFYVWQKDSFSKIIADADLAIIPIDKSDKMHWNKPENKLLLFWEIGIPVITSNTPAYTKVMNQATLPLLCTTIEDWVQKIEAFANMSELERSRLVLKANDYFEKNHSKEIILSKWDAIFLSLF
jgi:hypothetical protein